MAAQLQSNIYGDDAEPLIVMHEGDLEYAIFAPEIGTHQLVVVAMGQEPHFALSDTSHESLEGALAAMHCWVINEYAGS